GDQFLGAEHGGLVEPALDQVDPRPGLPDPADLEGEVPPGVLLLELDLLATEQLAPLDILDRPVAGPVEGSVDHVVADQLGREIVVGDHVRPLPAVHFQNPHVQLRLPAGEGDVLGRQGLRLARHLDGELPVLGGGLLPVLVVPGGEQAGGNDKQQTGNDRAHGVTSSRVRGANWYGVYPARWSVQLPPIGNAPGPARTGRPARSDGPPAGELRRVGPAPDPSSGYLVSLNELRKVFTPSPPMNSSVPMAITMYSRFETR